MQPDWQMIDFSWKQEWIIWLTAPAFECNWQKRKGNMESLVWKYTVESAVYGTHYGTHEHYLSAFISSDVLRFYIVRAANVFLFSLFHKCYNSGINALKLIHVVRIEDL